MGDKMKNTINVVLVRILRVLTDICQKNNQMTNI